MYVSIAMKLSKYLTGLLCIVYQQLIKVNTNSFMCDAVSPQGVRVHLEFISDVVLALQWHANHVSCVPVGQTGTLVVKDKSITSLLLTKCWKHLTRLLKIILL